MTDKSTIYPRFLGVDDGGDFVWELASGRWTWGDDPYAAATRERTFTPDRYSEKYGAPTPLAPSGLLGHAPVPAEPVEDPTTPVTNQKLAVWGTLQSMLGALDGWIEGARDNHEGMGHRGENTGDECWRQFAPSDIRSMVNDVARELGVAEIPAPAEPVEDKVR